MTGPFFADEIQRPVTKTAMISDCGAYRYDLQRWWVDGSQPLCVVMVNPSMADADIDDPTILRLMGFARRWGYGGLIVRNLFALRSPSPDVLDAAEDPVGPENDFKLSALLRNCVHFGLPVLAAWGANGARMRRDEAFIMQAREARVPLICLGLTKDGHPKHPLARGQHRVPDDFQPIPFAEAA
jgi:hypothetical protein